MSVLNPIILPLKNPPVTAKNAKEISLCENPISIMEIPTVLMQRAIQTCDTKTELVVYMAILRFTLGFNRNTCTLSRRFLEKWTGIKNQNIGRGIEGLIQKGLIEKLPESNMKHGDVYKVLHFSETSHKNEPITRNQNESTKPLECNQIESTLSAINLIAVRSQSDCEAPSKRLRSAINLSAKNKKEELEESSSFLESFQNHIASLKEAHLQRSERKALNALREKYSDTQIHTALLQAKKQGTTNGHAITLPLCYLASGSSMENLLKTALKAQSEADNWARVQELAERQKAQEAVKAKAIADRELAASLAFEATFPSEETKQEILQKIIKETLRFSNPNGKTAKKIALLRWFDSHTKVAGARA